MTLRLTACIISFLLCLTGCAPTRAVLPGERPEDLTASLTKDDLGHYVTVHLTDGDKMEGVLVSYDETSIQIRLFRRNEPFVVPVGEIDRMEVETNSAHALPVGLSIPIFAFMALVIYVFLQVDDARR